MSAFIMTLTQAGLAALVNVQAGTIGPVQISEIGFSDAAFTLSSTLEILPGEIKRLPVSGDVLGDDLIHVTALDSSSDAYGYRAFALYTSTGLLFAIYGQVDRIAEKSAGTTGFVALDIAMAKGQTQGLTFGDTSFINPPASTEMQGVVELATVAEGQAGADPFRALTPAVARAVVLGWLLAQDGAGSGLDADLFRGLAPSYFTDIPARLGYVPLNQAAFNAGEIIARLLNVDGAGSGLDADLFRGLAPSYFTDIVGRLGFMPVEQGGGWGQSSNKVRIGWSGSRLRAQVDSTDLGNMVFDSNVADVWRASNDGSGSGLDADLLRGLPPSYFTDIAARLGYVPLNQATFNAGEIIARLLNVDGAGSGLDADLLRGLPPAYYTDIVGRLGYVPLNQATFNAGEIMGRMQSVDGAGSGLDADLWQGRTPGQLFAAFCSAGQNENGYWRKSPTGNGDYVLECWGEGVAYDQWSPIQTFPQPFKDMGSINLHVTCQDGNNTAADGNKLNARKLSTSTFQIGSDDNPKNAFWRAIGFAD